MTIRRSAETGQVFRGINSSDVSFTAVKNTGTVIIEAEINDYSTVQDKVMNEHTSARVYDSMNIVTSITKPLSSQPIFRALNTDIATINQNGQTTKVADGIGSFVTEVTGFKKRLDHDYTERGGEEATVFERWADGSLAKHCTDAVEMRVSGATPSEAIYIFDSQMPYVRNADCWAGDYDLTGISPYNTTGGVTRAGTAIARDAAALAEHYKIAVGDNIYFVDADGNQVIREVNDRASVPGGTGAETDICIVTFDELPENIAHYSVLPSNALDYLPNLTETIPCLCLDQEEKALITNLYSLGDTAYFTAPHGTTADYHENLIAGDSGNPFFLLINDELVLVSTASYGGAGEGPDYSDWHTEIETAMTEAGSAYGLTIADLSNFNDYS